MTNFFDEERENRPIDPSNSFDELSSDGSPDEAMDPNRLAALIEGQLSEQDREELVASIGPADAAGVLSDAMAALADIEEVPTAMRARARRWHPGVWMALAACVAGVLLFPVAWLRSHRTTDVGPGQYAALLAAHGVRMPAGWNDTPWDVTRGAEELTPEARAFRIGVRLTDLGLAAQGADSSAAQYAAEIAALVDQSPGAEPVAAAFRAIARSSEPARATQVDSASRAVLTLPDAELTRFGAWTEGARLAARVRDGEYFAKSRLPAGSGVPLLTPLPPDIRQAIATVDRMNAPSTAWEHLDALLTALANTMAR